MRIKDIDNQIKDHFKLIDNCLYNETINELDIQSKRFIYRRLFLPFTFLERGMFISDTNTNILIPKDE